MLHPAHPLDFNALIRIDGKFNHKALRYVTSSILLLLSVS
jgi:hypothetical protein